MNRKKHIYDIFHTHRQELMNMGVKMIGVFGSVVRGDDSYNSDYDILVEFDENHHDYKCFNQLCDFIEKYIGNNYDLVTKQGLSPYLGERILQEVEYVKIAS
jgi:uncharacterized protein